MSDQFASCDTFVFINDKELVFGKNADRPQNEVQEVVYFPAASHPANAKLQCTYIEIPQVERTAAVVLSKPSWMRYGAESGSNEFGVVIGNEAIYNINTDEHEKELKKPGLLGQDLLRLALERSKTADEAVTVLGDLLAAHGQGGLCAEPGKGYDDLVYENSFLIADPKEAWVFETVGREWAAEKVTAGGRNISNCLTITSKIDRESAGLRKLAQDKGRWDGKPETFSFAECFKSKSGQDTSRYDAGRKYLEAFADGSKKFDIFSMMVILRDEESSICRGIECTYPTQGAQISVLSGKARHVHLFTGTPNTRLSVFKPFVFVKGIEKLTKLISEPIASGSWVHLLYSKHGQAYQQLKANENDLNTALRGVEKACVEELLQQLSGTDELNDQQALELSELFDDSVDAELRFYK